MLEELRIENLAVIPGAEIVFAPGLNVISGETGAGKTILAQAIALLLGVRADSGLIRPDTDTATVEAVFSFPPGYFADLADVVELPEGEGLAVRRRLSREGHSRAFVGGRAANLSVLEQLTGRLMSFSAQHEHQRLMMASNQLDILDSFCGRELLDLRDEYQALFDRRREIVRAFEESSNDVEARMREAELLKFQLEELDAAALVEDEEEELLRRRKALQRSGELKEVSAEAAALLGGIEGGSGSGEDIMAAISAARGRLESLSGVDRDLDEIAARLERTFFELEDLGSVCRDYHEGLLTDPELLAEIEERLDLIAQLKRKYGTSIREVIAYADGAQKRLASLQATEADHTALDAELAEAEAELVGLAKSMSRLRHEAAGRLAGEVESHLRDLSFADCGFQARLSGGEQEGGVQACMLTRSGADEMGFFVSLNPGMPATPLKETASGGELSRILLSVKCAVSAAGDAATLVFDEIDAGIGGETGSAVGAKLKQLARDAQVICITHLPQIACFADAHFAVMKGVDAAAGETVTEVERLEGDEVVDELCRMMGSRPDDGKARAHAESLINKAATV